MQGTYEENSLNRNMKRASCSPKINKMIKVGNKNNFHEQSILNKIAKIPSHNESRIILNKMLKKTTSTSLGIGKLSFKLPLNLIYKSIKNDDDISSNRISMSNRINSQLPTARTSAKSVPYINPKISISVKKL